MFYNNNFMTGAVYAPFCRTINPPIDSWQNDLEKMADLGYKCFHGFAEWHDIEKKDNVFDFSNVDRIIELGDKYGLKVIINIATVYGIGFYPPRWIMRKMTSDGFVTPQGPVIRNGPYRIPCFDDPLYIEYSNRFIGALGKHYANDDRIAAWVIWGEPKMYENTCYCQHTKKRYIDWLICKYADIENLNSFWGSEGPAEFVDFNEIEPPEAGGRHRGSYAMWSDWCTFRENNLAEQIETLSQLLFAAGSTQPTITEIMGWNSNSTNSGVDVWRLARTSDIVGVSNFANPGRDTAFILARADSCAKLNNKDYFVVEAQGGPRYMNINRGVTNSDKIHILETIQAAAMGSKGLMYWGYRPRLSDTEGGEFGLIMANGKILPRAVACGNISQQLYNTGDIITKSKRISEIAILDSQEAHHICLADNCQQWTMDAVKGAYHYFNNKYYNVDLISPERILSDSLLSMYKVLVLPYVYVLDNELIEKLVDYVAAGGLVIADYGLGLKDPNGFCYMDLPGGKLRSLFGVEKIDVQYMPTAQCSQLFKDILSVNDASVLLSDQDAPLITYNSYGKGGSLYISNNIFYEYGLTNCDRYYSNIMKIMFQFAIKPYMEIVPIEGNSNSIISSMLTNVNGDNILFIINLGDDCIFNIYLRNIYKCAANLFTKDEITMSNGYLLPLIDLKKHDYLSILLQQTTIN
jgi:beta-galactosidase